MDPNANLQEQEEILTMSAEDKRYVFGAMYGRESAARLRELRSALRGWLYSGGFEPDWTAYPKASRYFGK